LQVLDLTTYFWLCSFFIQNDECETVQETVKVFDDFHRFLPLAHEMLFGASWAKTPLG
jgi:hypothetical protein